ncbi:MAG: CRISPR-associated helicase Cas3' [Bacteroidales bacterium]
MNYDIKYFNDFIINAPFYFAHLPKNGQSKKPELLSEHSALVYSYARILVEKKALDKIIKNLIINFIPENLAQKQLLAEKIEQLFWQAIAFHDLGKVNAQFQKDRMRNSAVALKKVDHVFNSQHSVISMYVFLAMFFADLLNLNISDEEKVFLWNIALYLSYPILKHHSPLMEKAQDDTCWTNENLFSLHPFLSLFKCGLNKKEIDSFHSYLKNANFNFLFDRFNDFDRQKGAFPLFVLIKLNYSLLTAADYLATAHFMNDWKQMLTNIELLDTSLKDKIIRNAQIYNYNESIYKAMDDKEVIAPDNYTLPSNVNLNILRKYIAMEVVENVRQHSEQSLFYIEAPTGGGKTNVSMLALTELLRSDSENVISNVFYVFPFTTLITQTYKSLSDTLGLIEGEIAEIHSKAPYQTGYYEEDYLNYLNNLFMNYPITLLSHIHFFEVLKTNQKEANYLLHRMANSVVIIDEIQSYPPKIWDKIVYFIVNYAQYFNMKFIIMSATLPKIGDIIENKFLTNKFVYLIKDKTKYFQNPNFCNRVKFDYSLLSWSTPDAKSKSEYLQNLKKMVLDKSIEYSKSNLIYPNSVFTIVEFIFKKTASEFYISVIENKEFFDAIYLLSGTILEPRRKEIIAKLKSAEIRKQKILLISTQVVEAGVDIDMDLGFKDKSIIDSEEQLAGRINRNVNKTECTLYLFNCDSEKILYKSDDRYKVMNTLQNDYQEILRTKNFDQFYNLVINKLKTTNESIYTINLEDFIEKIAVLDFKKADADLNIIDTKTVSVFVPLLIATEYLEQSLPILNKFKIQYDEFVSGADIWNCYDSVIKNQNEDFVTNKIKMKEIQALMSNFVFSIFSGGTDYDNLQTYGKIKYGFLYLENYSEIYSLDNGINTQRLKESNFI